MLQSNKLNVLTLYPSILSYNLLSADGVLQPFVQVPFYGERVIGMELVYGCPARLIFLPGGGTLIGDENELIWGRSGLVDHFTPDHLVMSLKPTINRLASDLCKRPTITVCHVLVNDGIQLLDVSTIDDCEVINSWSIQKLKKWRDDDGGQYFLDYDNLMKFADRFDLQTAPIIFDGRSIIPYGLKAICEWLSNLDMPDLIVRNIDRSKIASLSYGYYQEYKFLTDK